jgi:hypothetical protein
MQTATRHPTLLRTALIMTALAMMSMLLPTSDAESAASSRYVDAVRETTSADAAERTAHGSPWNRRPAHGRSVHGAAVPSPQILDNFEIVSHLELGGRPVDADVFYFDHGTDVGQFAYVGSGADVCVGRGVKIVDVTDPATPDRVAIAHLDIRDVSYEDPVVMSVGARIVLAVGIQICGPDGRGGLGLIDVTDPRDPIPLSFHETASGGVHELDLTTLSDGRPAALVAVPFGEVSGGKDFQIVDISRPRRPAVVAGWGVIEDSSLPVPNVTDPASETPEVTTCCQGIGVAFADFFFHSARGADGGRTAYVSHWDLGIVKIDISDPGHPTPIGRTVYPFDAEGEGHSLTTYESGGVRYILQNDEDIEPISPAYVRTSVTGDKTWAVLEEPWMPSVLLEVGPLEGEIHDAGRGCDRSDYRDAKGKIALANARDPFVGPLPCRLGRQILMAAEAGAEAFVFNFVSSDRPAAWYQPSAKTLREIGREAAGMPVLGPASIDGLARVVRRANGPVTMTLEAGIPEYGFLRVFSEEDGSDLDGDGVVEYPQVGEFAELPHVRGEFPPPEGDWTIHNTEVWGDRSFSSWYSHGVVALDLADPTDPVLVGQFAPPGDIGRVSPHLSDQVPYVWGVAIDEERGLVYASDMRSGLWILRPTGPAVPTVS